MICIYPLSKEHRGWMTVTAKEHSVQISFTVCTRSEPRESAGLGGCGRLAQGVL